MDDRIEPFVCLDVEKDVDLEILKSRLDALFPKQIVRLKMDGKYTPYFYDGEGNWHYKIPEPMGDCVKFYSEYNSEYNMDQYLSEAQLETLKFLDAPLENFKTAGNIIVNNEHIDGVFFTDGSYIIIDQTIIDRSKDLSDFMIDFYDCQIVVDMTNTMYDGMIIIKTDKQLFVTYQGNIND